MTRIAGEVTIKAPPEAVFDLVADECNEPRYNPRIVRVERLTATPVGVGATFLAEPKGMGSKGQMKVTTVEYDRPHRLRSRIESSYTRVDGTLSFHESHGQTRLAWDWDMALLGPMRILTPLLTLVGSRWERRNWMDLKTFVEAGQH